MSTPGSGRRTPSRGSRPAGRGGPGRAQRPTRTRTSAAGSAPGARQPAAATLPRPRLTSRAAVLVLIVAVLAVSYSSLMRAYLQQRDHSSEASIARLERQKERLNDPAYVQQQAREQGFVMPGEKPFVVLDGGEPLDVEASLGDPAQVDPAEPEAWWDDAWASMEVAGNPPKRTDPLPETTITDPEGAPTSGPEAEPEPEDGE